MLVVHHKNSSLKIDEGYEWVLYDLFLINEDRLPDADFHRLVAADSAVTMVTVDLSQVHEDYMSNSDLFWRNYWEKFREQAHT